MTPLLRLTNVSKSFGGVRALRDVSFELLSGEVHALVGENGSGKSTLIKTITGAVQPDAGTLEFNGQCVTEHDPLKARALGVAAIYQQPALFPDLTVAENIAIALESPGMCRRIHWRSRYTRARELLAQLGAKIDPSAEVRSLSMPEQQLVEIAKAIGADAKAVIMDEPTASLSEREVENLFRVIGELKGRGVGILYVSHRLDELPRIADRVTALRDGCLVGTHLMNTTTRGELIRMMVGRELAAVFPKVSVPIGQVVLAVHNLTSQASGVRGVSLSVRSGEIVALAGLIGAGRTELARVIFGLTPADEGEISLHGKRVSIDSPAGAVAHGIAYVPEDRRRYGVILDLPVSANATLAVLRKVSRHGFLNFRHERALAEALVQKFGVKTPSVDDPAGNLSGGNQQKVALARWLATEPTVIILDEPTQGVDIGAKAEIHKLICDLAASGLAIIMISSELPEVLGMADRIVVMHGGEVTGTLERSEATQERVLELALGHLAAKAVPA
jgi:rhamnose transport system ATP-binding protein